MAYTTEEYLIIENLIHLDSFTNAKPGQTVGELLSSLGPNDYCGGSMNEAQWHEMIGEITSNPEYQDILDLKIADTHTDNAPGGGGGTMAILTNDTGEALVAFAGSAGGEWGDNFEGGGMTNGSDGVSTQQQENALQWYQEKYEELGLDQYDVTAIGHSKGGNKAKYITLMDDTVDHCVSFDGQGFSDEFFDEYPDKIAANQHKIENHNLDNDPVNLLLNDVGETTYYKHLPADGKYDDAHHPYALFKNGKLELNSVCEQAPELKALDKCLNSLMRSMPPEKKQDLLTLIGTVVQGGMDGKDVGNLFRELLQDPANKDNAGYLIAYLLNYAQKNPEMYGYVADAMNKMGLGEFVKYVDVAQKILSCPYINKLLDLLSGGADKLANSDFVKWLFGFLNLGISWEDFLLILGVLGPAMDYMDEIDVEEHNGNDLTVGSGSSNPFFNFPAIFNVKTQCLWDAYNALTGCAELVKGKKQEMMDIRENLGPFQVLGLWRINRAINKLDTVEKSLAKMATYSKEIAGLYEGYEQRVIDAVPNV